MKLTIIWFLFTILTIHLTTALSLPPEPHRLLARARGRGSNGDGGEGPGGRGSFHRNAGSRGGRNRATEPPPPGPPPPPPPGPPPPSPPAPAVQLGGTTQPVRRQNDNGDSVPQQAGPSLPSPSASSSSSESMPTTPQLTKQTDFVYEPVDEDVLSFEKVYEPVDEVVYDYEDVYEPVWEYVDQYSPVHEPTWEYVDEYSPVYEPTLDYVDQDVAEFSPTTEYHVEYSEEYSPSFSPPEPDDPKPNGKPVNINNNNNHIGINLDMSHHLDEEQHPDHHNDHSAPGTAIAPYTPLLPDATSPNPPGKTHYPTMVHLLQEDSPHQIATDPAGGIRVQTVKGAHRIGSILSWPASSKPRRCQLVFNMPKTGGGRVHAHALSGLAEGATWGKKPSRGKHLGTWNAGYGGTEGKWEVGTGEVACGTPVELSWADGTDGGVWWSTSGVGVVMLGDGATNVAQTTGTVAATKPKKAPVRVRGPVKKVYRHGGRV